MELIINGSTYTLRSVNSERRNIFVQKVLSIYDYRSANFDAFLKDTQKVLKEKHKLDMTLDQVKSNFFKHYSIGLHTSIWSFLSSEDKKSLKTIDNLKIHENELKKFIEYVCKKIREYSSYVKTNHNKGTSEDIHSVYSYLSRVYGWTFDEIKEMDELELMKAIENATQIIERENASNINANALAAAYGTGSKKAKSQIDSINRKISTKSKMRTAGNVTPKEDSISREDIKRMMEARNG